MTDSMIFHNPIFTIEHEPDSHDSNMHCYVDKWHGALALIQNKMLKQIPSLCFWQRFEPAAALKKHLPSFDFCTCLAAYGIVQYMSVPNLEEYAALRTGRSLTLYPPQIVELSKGFCAQR